MNRVITQTLLFLPLFVAAGCRPATAVNAAAPVSQVQTLVILTPHSEPIRQTFAAGFSSWHTAHRGAPVHIHWIYRGTPQCVEYIRALPQMQVEGTPGGAVDLMFGGGIVDHVQLARDGMTRALSLPDDALAGIPAEVAGQATRDPAGHWVATGLSSFGIVYNERACRQRGIAPPTSWADLADPRFAGWVAIANPQASGSHRESLALIVRKEGWERGWATILPILANARALNARSGEALRQVASGVSLATRAVNFDGMALAAESGGDVRYFDPPGASAITLDLISMPTAARAPALAVDFIRYVLSPEGQALWAVERDRRVPHGVTLYHYAIRPSVYEAYAGGLAVPGNPLEMDFGLQVDPQQSLADATRLQALVAAACAGENHVMLQRTWERLAARGLPAGPLAELTSLPETAADAARLDADGRPDPDLVRAFAEKYARALSS